MFKGGKGDKKEDKRVHPKNEDEEEDEETPTQGAIVTYPLVHGLGNTPGPCPAKSQFARYLELDLSGPVASQDEEEGVDKSPSTAIPGPTHDCLKYTY